MYDSEAIIYNISRYVFFCYIKLWSDKTNNIIWLFFKFRPINNRWLNWAKQLASWVMRIKRRKGLAPDWIPTCDPSSCSQTFALSGTLIKISDPGVGYIVTSCQIKSHSDRFGGAPMAREREQGSVLTILDLTSSDTLF